MSKKFLVVMMVFMVFIIACGNKTATSNEEMLEIIKEKEDLSLNITNCGTVIENDIVLIIGVTGENEQTYNYYAGQFLSDKKQNYKFDKMVL